MVNVKSIINPQTTISDETMKIEADVIVTATVLGFVYKRYQNAEPCSFDIQHPAPMDYVKWTFIANNLSRMESLTINDLLEFRNLFDEQELQGLSTTEIEDFAIIIQSINQYRNTYPQMVEFFYFLLGVVQEEMAMLIELEDSDDDDEFMQDLKQTFIAPLERNIIAMNSYIKEFATSQTSIKKDVDYLKIEAVKTVFRDLKNLFKKTHEKLEEFVVEYQEFLNVLSAMSEVLGVTTKPKWRQEVIKIAKTKKKAIKKVRVLEESRHREVEVTTVEIQPQDLKPVDIKPSDILQLGLRPQALQMKPGDWLEDGQSPAWVEGAMIKGAPRGASIVPSRRQLISRKTTRRLLQDYQEQESQGRRYYEGRGAYTGMIYDPKETDNSFIQPTKRVIDSDPKRWHPGNQHPLKKRWGLIGGDKDFNLDSNPDIGMGLLPTTKQQNGLSLTERIGYIHGMSSAIHRCEQLRTKRDQAKYLCVPFEMATGKVTTKMASCFACCTYMYATKYPPSSMHLGRGESWILPSSRNMVTGETTPMPKYNKDIINRLAQGWHKEVYDYMSFGVSYLKPAVGKNLVKESHKPHVEKLENALKAIPLLERKVRGGNLFLDALTVHQSDWKRIRETLRPTYDRLVQLSSKRSLIEENENSFPVQSFSTMSSLEKPVLLNGMKVLFDKIVPASPVDLVPKDKFPKKTRRKG